MSWDFHVGAVLYRRRYWNLYSYAFIHYDFTHLLVNMLYLGLYGTLMEMLLGHGLALVFYALVIPLCVAPHLLLFYSKPQYNTNGISGTNSALIVFVLLADPGLHYKVFLACAYVALCFIEWLRKPLLSWNRIDHLAHLAGALTGGIAYFVCQQLNLIRT